MSEPLNLGSGFSLRFADWAPDRNIPENAERYKGIPDIPKVSAILMCRCGVEGVISFDVPHAREVFPSSIFWTVESWEPLTISPSVQCACPARCHGFIREGKWVDA